MPDTFVESFNRAFQFGHQMENDARAQKAAQIQQQVQTMQLQKMARELAGQQALGKSLEDVQTVTPKQIGEPITPGGGFEVKPGLETLNITTQTKSPEMESILAQYPKAYQPFAERAARTQNFDILEKIPKIPQTQEGQTLEAILAQKVKSGELTLSEALAMKTAKKEFNIPGPVDEFLMTKFPNYASDPKIRETAVNYLSTPEGRGAYLKWKSDVGETRPVNIQFVPTAEGIIPVNPRTVQQEGPPIGGKPLASEQIVALQQIDTLRAALATAKNLYKPEYVGPVAGRMYDISEKLAGGVGIDTNQAKFYSSLEQSRNGLVYLLSGKQINEMEFQRLNKQLPDRILNPTVFKARMEEFERTLTSVLESREKRLKEGGYGKKVVTPETKTETPSQQPSKYKIIRIR